MKTDPFVYHGTSRDHLAGIAQQGLVPREPDSDGWPEYDYDDDDHLEDAFEARLFVFEDFEVAKELTSTSIASSATVRPASSAARSLMAYTHARPIWPMRRSARAP